MLIDTDFVRYGMQLADLTSSDIFVDRDLGHLLVPHDLFATTYLVGEMETNEFFDRQARGLGQQPKTFKGIPIRTIPYSAETDRRNYGSGISGLMDLLMEGSSLEPEFLARNNQIFHTKLVGDVGPKGTELYYPLKSQLFGQTVDSIASSKTWKFEYSRGWDWYHSTQLYGMDPTTQIYRPTALLGFPLTEFNHALTVLGEFHPQVPKDSFNWGLPGLPVPGVVGSHYFGWGYYCYYGFINLQYDSNVIRWSEYSVDFHVSDIRWAECSLQYELLGPADVSNELQPDFDGITYNLGLTFKRETNRTYPWGGGYWYSESKSRIVPVRCFPLTLSARITTEQTTKLEAAMRRYQKRSRNHAKHVRPLVQTLVAKAYERFTTSKDSWIETTYEAGELPALVPTDSVGQICDEALALSERQSLSTKQMKILKDAVWRLRAWETQMKTGYRLNSSLRIAWGRYLLAFASTVSDIYLLYSFGVRPALSLPELLEDTIRKWAASALLREETRFRVSEKSSYEFLQDLGITNVKVTLGVSVGGFDDLNTERILKGDTLGVLPRPSRLWDCVQFSFLIDYPLQVSQRMSLVESWFLFHSLAPKNWVISYKWESTEEYTKMVLDDCGLANYTSSSAKFVNYAREVSAFVPYTFNYDSYAKLFPTNWNLAVVLALVTKTFTQSISQLFK